MRFSQCWGVRTAGTQGVALWACPTVADPERLTSAGQDRHYAYPVATPRAGTERCLSINLEASGRWGSCS